jgi:hypothetical protein
MPPMLHTIEISRRVYVQGELAGQLGDGRLMVRDGSKVYCGRPVDTDSRSDTAR